MASITSNKGTCETANKNTRQHEMQPSVRQNKSCVKKEACSSWREAFIALGWAYNCLAPSRAFPCCCRCRPPSHRLLRLHLAIAAPHVLDVRGGWKPRSHSSSHPRPIVAAARSSRGAAPPVRRRLGRVSSAAWSVSHPLCSVEIAMLVLTICCLGQRIALILVRLRVTLTLLII
jgi:hypothetical protein